MKHKIIVITILFTIFLLMSACQEDVMSVAEDVMREASATKLPTTTPNPVIVYTNTPTPTLTPTITMTPTLTLTPTVTLTPTSTPFTGFEQSSLNSAVQRYGQNEFTFTVPGVSQSYYAVVNDYGLDCSPSTYTTDQLVCTGSAFSIYGTTEFTFYSDSTLEKMIHQGNYPVSLYVVVVATPVPTKPPYTIVWAGTTCPRRGENVSCEIEYRSYNGEPCVAASCFDACGWYYSYDNCPYGSDDNFIWIAKPPGW